jgi:hypothetical protein
MAAMKVLTAKVVNGKVDIAGDFEEGATVTVLGAVADSPPLTPSEEQELEDALAASARVSSSTGASSWRT